MKGAKPRTPPRTADHRRLARAKAFLTWGTAVFGVALLPLLFVVEQSVGLGLLFKLRGAVPPPDEVVVIAIDEVAEAAFGTPIDRARHAQLIDELARGGASLLVLDLFFHTESPDDARLATAIRAAGNVVLIAEVERTTEAGIDVQVLRRPQEPLAAAAFGSAPSLVPEAFRLDWMFAHDAADRPTVPIVALQAFWFEEFMATLFTVRPELGARFPRTLGELGEARPLDQVMAELRTTFVGDAALADDMRARSGADARGLAPLIDTYARERSLQGNRLYLNFYGPPRTIRTIPYAVALAEGFRGEETVVSGKVVFVGFSARRQPRQRDDYPYVFSTGGFNLSGVEVAATAFANLLHDDAVKLPSMPARVALVVLWGLAVVAVFRYAPVRAGLVGAVLLGTAYLIVAARLFETQNLWLPIVVPTLQLLFAGTLALRLTQLSERWQLGSGTSEEAALALTGRGKAEKIDNRVILFADERGSKKRLRHALTELDVEQRRVLQRELATARDVPIVDNGGHINHTLADSLLAFWMTPTRNGGVEVVQAASAACKAALAIHASIAKLNEKYVGFDIGLRIGLDAGEILSHLNPSPEIKDWRMEGTPIHAAERLESLNKLMGTSTLISQIVAERLDPRSFHCHELGTFVFCDEGGDVVVDAVRVHELSAASAVSDDQRAHARRFGTALELLRQLDWAPAMAIFGELSLQATAHSRLAARYAEWCRQTIDEDNPRWRGVVAVTSSDKSQSLDRFAG
jgi:adenylate cyclase